MDKFTKAIERIGYAYPTDLSIRENFLEFIGLFTEDVKRSLRRQFVYEEEHVPMRLSSLGKTPAFELLGKKLGLVKQGSKYTVNERLRMIFTMGDFIESYVLFLLRRVGYNIVNTQCDVNWNGVPGHTDAIIKDEFGITRLLEIKSSNDWYFKEVRKRGHPGDERGYLTQLLTYSDSLGIPRDRTHWVFINKNTCELMVVNLSDVDADYANSRLNRAKRVCEIYFDCESEKDLYSSVQPPPPSIEKNKKGEYVLDDYGEIKLYPPSSVAYPSFCYKLETGKTRWGVKRDYVVDYNYPDEYAEFKPNVKQMALAFDDC